MKLKGLARIVLAVSYFGGIYSALAGLFCYPFNQEDSKKIIEYGLAVGIISAGLSYLIRDRNYSDENSDKRE